MEYLGFNLYGNPEILYNLERFYVEYLRGFDLHLAYKKTTSTSITNCLNPYYNNYPLKFFKGKSLEIVERICLQNDRRVGRRMPKRKC